ncbi:MAG: HEAT repeat domain-containing protein [Fidelibacterota bacterium]
MYLYSALSESDRRELEDHISECNRCKEILERERSFNSAFSSSARKITVESYLRECRERLFLTLSEYVIGEQSWWSGIARWLTFRRPLLLRTAYSFGILIFGVVVGYLLFSALKTPGISSPEFSEFKRGVPSESNVPIAGSIFDFSAVKADISEIKIVEYDSLKGRVKLNFRAGYLINFEGLAQQPEIADILSLVLRESPSPELKLDAINIIKAAPNRDIIKDALIYALLWDENPGVRLEAAGALSTMPDDRKVKDALILSLRNDPNPGVRIKAIEALKNLTDADVISVMREKAYSDENLYIRMEARKSLHNTGPVLIERDE